MAKTRKRYKPLKYFPKQQFKMLGNNNNCRSFQPIVRIKRLPVEIVNSFLSKTPPVSKRPHFSQESLTAPTEDNHCNASNDAKLSLSSKNSVKASFSKQELNNLNKVASNNQCESSNMQPLHHLPPSHKNNVHSNSPERKISPLETPSPSSKTKQRPKLEYNFVSVDHHSSPSNKVPINNTSHNNDIYRRLKEVTVNDNNKVDVCVQNKDEPEEKKKICGGVVTVSKVQKKVECTEKQSLSKDNKCSLTEVKQSDQNANVFARPLVRQGRLRCNKNREVSFNQTSKNVNTIKEPIPVMCSDKSIRKKRNTREGGTTSLVKKKLCTKKETLSEDDKCSSLTKANIKTSDQNDNVVFDPLVEQVNVAVSKNKDILLDEPESTCKHEDAFKLPNLVTSTRSESNPKKINITSCAKEKEVCSFGINSINIPEVQEVAEIENEDDDADTLSINASTSMLDTLMPGTVNLQAPAYISKNTSCKDNVCSSKTETEVTSTCKQFPEESLYYESEHSSTNNSNSSGSSRNSSSSTTNSSSSVSNQNSEQCIESNQEIDVVDNIPQVDRMEFYLADNRFNPDQVEFLDDYTDANSVHEVQEVESNFKPLIISSDFNEVEARNYNDTKTEHDKFIIPRKRGFCGNTTSNEQIKKSKFCTSHTENRRGFNSQYSPVVKDENNPEEEVEDGLYYTKKRSFEKLSEKQPQNPQVHESEVEILCTKNMKYDTPSTSKSSPRDSSSSKSVSSNSLNVVNKYNDIRERKLLISLFDGNICEDYLMNKCMNHVNCSFNHYTPLNLYKKALNQRAVNQEVIDKVFYKFLDGDGLQAHFYNNLLEYYCGRNDKEAVDKLAAFLPNEIYSEGKTKQHWRRIVSFYQNFWKCDIYTAINYILKTFFIKPSISYYVINRFIYLFSETYKKGKLWNTFKVLAKHPHYYLPVFMVQKFFDECLNETPIDIPKCKELLKYVERSHVLVRKFKLSLVQLSKIVLRTEGFYNDADDTNVLSFLSSNWQSQSEQKLTPLKQKRYSNETEFLNDFEYAVCQNNIPLILDMIFNVDSIRLLYTAANLYLKVTNSDTNKLEMCLERYTANVQTYSQTKFVNLFLTYVSWFIIAFKMEKEEVDWSVVYSLFRSIKHHNLDYLTDELVMYLHERPLTPALRALLTVEICVGYRKYTEADTQLHINGLWSDTRHCSTRVQLEESDFETLYQALHSFLRVLMTENQTESLDEVLTGIALHLFDELHSAGQISSESFNNYHLDNLLEALLMNKMYPQVLTTLRKLEDILEIINVFDDVVIRSIIVIAYRDPNVRNENYFQELVEDAFSSGVYKQVKVKECTLYIKSYWLEEELMLFFKRYLRELYVNKRNLAYDCISMPIEHEEFLTKFPPLLRETDNSIEGILHRIQYVLSTFSKNINTRIEAQRILRVDVKSLLENLNLNLLE